MLGISGGLVPCPTAIVLLLMAISIRRFTWGLALIASFSFGLAAVLIIVGFLIIYARSWLERFSIGGKIFKAISVLSALTIILIGLMIILGSL